MHGLTFDDWFKVAGAVGAICTFLYTYLTWHEKSKQEFEATRAQSEHDASTRRIEATKPFLDLQLRRYIDITQVVSCLAASEDEAEMAGAFKAFWRFYYGELALVESPEVEAAMVAIGAELRRFEATAIAPEEGKAEAQDGGGAAAAARTPAIADRRKLRLQALNLTAAIRGSLDDSWEVKAWSGEKRAAQKSR